MLKLPLHAINELMHSWRNLDVENSLHKGIFICVHLSYKRYRRESLYLVDGIALTSVGCYHLYDRYITLQDFNVTHISIEDAEIERVITITNSELLSSTILYSGPKFRLSEVNIKYFTYIKRLVEDYFIMNTLYKSYSDIYNNIHLSSFDRTTHRIKLKGLFEEIYKYIDEIKSVISLSETNYPVAFAQKVIGTTSSVNTK